MFNSLSELKVPMSQMGHFFRYSFERPKTSLNKAMLIFSNDVDAGSPNLGVLNESKRDSDVNLNLSEYAVGKIEEMCIPLMLEVFDEFDVKMTFGVRGQLTEVSNKVLELLCDSGVKHDIGAHGYYHRKFSELTCDEAEDELRLISAGFRKYGVTPRTFIFPRNCVAHLDLLEKHNYFCYRGYGSVTKDCMYIEKLGQLYNVHPSIFITRAANLYTLKKILGISVEKRLPFHVWFHFWGLGRDEKSMSKTAAELLIPFFRYAEEKRENGLLTFETMLSAAQKMERSGIRC
jgi:peptidoglycan/xylan/chitin deacetylase (PgdA/CDA1 family)